MIKVLVVEDSLVARELLVYILKSDPEVDVIGIARNGVEAIEFLQSNKPDVITMDVNMPKMDGFEATRKIMEANPVPIIIVSAVWNPKEVKTTFRAVEVGAVAVLEKPRGFNHPDHEKMAKEIIQKVRLMSEVKVVRRRAKYRNTKTVPISPPKSEYRPTSPEVNLVAIGASTGGPPVLQTILSKLPRDFSVPVLIVQHIAKGFIQGMVEWLEQSCSIPINVAAQNELLIPGEVYFAPDDFHMGLKSRSRIELVRTPPENSLRPAVSYLFRSVAEVFGQNAVGVLLTGMGKDGAKELGLMKQKGAVTIAQDKESSVVHGMPGEAIKLGTAEYILSPDKVAIKLESLVNKRNGRSKIKAKIM